MHHGHEEKDRNPKGIQLPDLYKFFRVASSTCSMSPWEIGLSLKVIVRDMSKKERARPYVKLPLPETGAFQGIQEPLKKITDRPFLENPDCVTSHFNGSKKPGLPSFK